MKANNAATKIQANFRGYRVRKQLKEGKSPQEDYSQGRPRGETRDDQSPASFSNPTSPDSADGIDNVDSTAPFQRQNTREALEEKSATKIQAGVRGFLVRKRQQAAQAAATRIQAGFRGFRTRKLLKQNGQ